MMLITYVLFQYRLSRRHRRHQITNKVDVDTEDWQWNVSGTNFKQSDTKH